MKLAAGRSTPSAEPLAVRPSSAETLLEREGELGELHNVLALAQEGRGRIVLVEAPAGLGKTTLLQAGCDSASGAGFACLRARATELERDFAYGCVRQLLEPVVAKAAEPERERLFGGAAALSKPLFVATGAHQAAPVPDGAFSMLHGLYWLLSNIADERPVALAVDDLQWSDTESLRFFTYLAPRLDGLPLAVLASTRSGETVSADLARLAAGPESTVLRPRPLSTGGIVRLCERRLGAEVAPEFAAACRDATGGNPFFLEALLREVCELGLSPGAREAPRVREIGPAAVAEAMLLRLSETPVATALVRALAVIGDRASVQEAARLAGISEATVGEAADLLVSLAILKPGPGLEFAHPIVREAVYADLGSHERADAHARAADILAAAGAHDERIAAQLVEAAPADDPERVELLRRVGADALARGAPAAAAAWLSRAVLENPRAEGRGELLLELGSAELRLGRREAVEHLSGAVELLRDPVRQATAVRQLAHALTQSGSAGEAVVAIVSAIDLLETHDREQALLLEGELGYHAQHAGLESRAVAAARLERLADLRGSTPGERLVLASLACERAVRSDSSAESQAHLERALAGWRAPEERQLNTAGLFYGVIVGLLGCDALDLAEASLEQALADARARASVPELAYVACWRGRASLRRGAVARAEADARMALELLTTHRLLGRRFALGLLVQALIEAGEVDDAERELRESGLGEEIPASRASNYLLEARALLHLARGRSREGLDDLLEFGRRDELYGAGNPHAARWRSQAALALAEIGDEERARSLAADDLERARSWGTASGIGVALHAVAVVEGSPGDRLQEAALALERSPARLDHARALIDLGAALRRANRRAEARGELERGLGLAERSGAGALAERARTELRAAGGRVSDPQGSGVEQLTVSERRVAELAAEGHSNPEIAQALFVTRKTVETHLGRVYRKLGISGRMNLAQMLGEQVSATDV
jgi:DNA-binding CsgD family transcriptional regulator